MPGTLIPPWYDWREPTRDEYAAASVVFGMSMALSASAIIRAGNQTNAQWRRTHRVTPYMVFVWLEILSSTIIGGVSWGYVRGAIPPSLWLFTGIIVMWCFQVHCILQIILNRVALIASNKTLVTRLKWGIFIFVCLINIAVACIWIPRRLQISHTYYVANEYWDRAEKIILALIDAGLNCYFIYLVRHSLISYGLTKYIALYRFNLVMIFISTAMDISLIGLMSLPNTWFYVVYHPFVYLIKLHIELFMAELIGKIVKGASRNSFCTCNCHRNSTFCQRDMWPASEPNAPLAPTLGRFRRWIPIRCTVSLGSHDQKRRDIALEQKSSNDPCVRMPPKSSVGDNTNDNSRHTESSNHSRQPASDDSPV